MYILRNRYVRGSQAIFTLISRNNYEISHKLSDQNIMIGGWGTLYNGLYGEVLHLKEVPSFRLLAYKGVGISRVEVYKRMGKSAI